MTGQSEDRLELKVLLRNLSAEIMRLACVAEKLDDTFGCLVKETPSIAASLSSETQVLDVLRQSLQAIGLIVETAASEVPDEHGINLSRVALAKGVTLEKVRVACLTKGLSEEAVLSSPPAAVGPEGNQVFFDEF